MASTPIAPALFSGFSSIPPASRGWSAGPVGEWTPPVHFSSVALAVTLPPAHADEFDEYDEEEEEERVNELMSKFDCNAIRRKIQRFLARKTMTQTAMLKQMEVNSNSFRRFMSYKGKYQGSDNCCYSSALLFFDHLEKQERAAKQQEKDTAKAATKTAGKTAGKAAATPKLSRAEQAAKAQELFDKVNAVTLDEPVYVFDDCDEVRKKIHELIESKAVTQSALLKELDVNSNSMRRFLTTKGKREGCSNGVYAAAYVFFERLRIAEGKPKTGKRVKMESEKPTGFSLQRDPTHTLVFVGRP